MNEQDFDNRIKETALKQDAQTESALWDKTGTWNRIEAGLAKRNRSVWWKVAAVLLLLFSIGMSYAQWDRFRNFRSEKETELNDLKQRINVLATDQQNLKASNQILLQQKSAEIDSMKKQLLQFKITDKSAKTRKSTILQHDYSDALKKEETDRNLIDSLQNTIQQLQATVQTYNQSVNPEGKTGMKQKTDSVENEITPERRIYYLSNHFQPENTKSRKGLKVGIFRVPDNKEVEYQSDHSIFKK